MIVMIILGLDLFFMLMLHGTYAHIVLLVVQMTPEENESDSLCSDDIYSAF